jgi:transcription elongation factor Elf1
VQSEVGQVSNWSEADLKRRAEKVNADVGLVCPCCGEQNAPYYFKIFVNERGNAACDNCGHTGPRQLFVRKEPA